MANFPRRSRLSKSLPEVLVDDSILPLFLEFLQRQGAQSVLNFWLAAETFRLSSQDKNLFSYKSRLKLKRNQEFSGNTSAVDISNDLHKIERNIHSTLTENKNLQKSPSRSDDNFDSLKSTGVESDSRVVEGASFPGLSMDACAVEPRNSENLSKTPAIFSSTSETDKNSPYDSSIRNNPLVNNSMNLKVTLPSHSDSVNTSTTISSVPAISTEQNTCTDHSVSQRNSSSNDQFEYKSSERHKNSDAASVSNVNKCSNTDSSECNAQFPSGKQAISCSSSASRSELCDEDRLQNDGSTREMIESQETVVLRRQESSDTRERRRRSKGTVS